MATCLGFDAEEADKTIHFSLFLKMLYLNILKAAEKLAVVFPKDWMAYFPRFLFIQHLWKERVHMFGIKTFVIAI